MTGSKGYLLEALIPETEHMRLGVGGYTTANDSIAGITLLTIIYNIKLLKP